MAPQTALAERLRELRLTGLTTGRLTQSQLGRALRASVPLISSWEHGTVPPPGRLDAYARLFARPDLPGGPRLVVPGIDELDPAERATYEVLRRELSALRGPGTPLPTEFTHPLQFPPGQAITVVCSELPERLRSVFGYADDLNPDHVASYKYADLDGLIELLPFLAQLNPTNPITVGISGELPTDALTAHLIALGGVDFNTVTAAVLVELDHVPVRQMDRPTDGDPGGFSVGTPDGRYDFRPRLRQSAERTTLREDVAHFLRAPNPYNRERTLTFFNGSYSRGSYGIVRALTAPKIRERNAAYITSRFYGIDTYSILCRVKIVANEVVVPDWTDDDIRLHEWPEGRA